MSVMKEIVQSHVYVHDLVVIMEKLDRALKGQAFISFDLASRGLGLNYCGHEDTPPSSGDAW